MTRINCVPVEELQSKFLLAEYRELPRISTLVWKWHSKTFIPDLNAFVLPFIPNQYVLGAGHVKFFYDKGEYLRKRFEEQIVPELQKRGFKLQFLTYRKHPDRLNKDWVPTEDAMRINRERIYNRLNKISL